MVPLPRVHATKPVSSFSWPPAGLPEGAESCEAEPNNGLTRMQKISLPCDLAGSFFPAADIDTFEFTANKGERLVGGSSLRATGATDESVDRGSACQR